MAIKRIKNGNVTRTINTRTGRTTISTRSGTITYSQSNQGHNRSTQTFSIGNGWFERKTTNWNKKPRRKKSLIGWSWLFSRSSSRKKIPPGKNSPGAVAANMPDNKSADIKEPDPWFWEIKTFKEFDTADWLIYLLVLPFRALYWFAIINIFCIMIYLMIKFLWWLIIG